MRIVPTSDRFQSLRSPMSRGRSSSGGVCGSGSPLTFTVATEPKTQLSTPALLSATHTHGTLSCAMRSRARRGVTRDVGAHREKLSDDDDGELASSGAEKHQSDRRSVQRSRPELRMRPETLC